MLNKEEVVRTITKQVMDSDLSQSIIKMLSNSTSSVISRANQDLTEKIKEDANTIIQTTVDNTANVILQNAELWAGKINGELTVFPEGTRYIYKNDPCTVILVEQPPQTRSIAWNAHHARFFLSFPYVQFILKFHHAKLAAVIVVCSKTSIKNLADACYELPLPNIGDGGVCMGQILNYQIDKSLSEMVGDVISKFWQSQFTSDHIGQLSSFFQHNFHEVFKNTAGIRAYNESFMHWENLTKEDNLLALSDKIQYKSMRKSYNDIIQNMKDADSKLSNQITKSVNQGMDSLSKEVQKILLSLNLEDQNNQKIHITNLQNVMREIIVAAYAECWRCCEEEVQEEKERLQYSFKLAINKFLQDLENKTK